LPEQADASRGGRPPLNNPGVRRPARHAVRGPFVIPCGRRTGRTRHPWHDPSFRRPPVGSPGLRLFLSAADASGKILVCNLSFLLQGLVSSGGWWLVAGGWWITPGGGALCSRGMLCRVTSGWSGIKQGFTWLWADTKRVSPAGRWGVSGCLSRRSRQGADARPLTIPASGGLRATLCAVPSSFPAADGPAGRAIRGAIRPFADFLSALLASVHFSALRTPLTNLRL